MFRPIYFRVPNTIKPAPKLPSIIFPKQSISITYSFQCPFQYHPLSIYNPLPDTKLSFQMEMVVYNPTYHCIAIARNGTLHENESVQITYYVQMYFQYSLTNKIKTNRSLIGPYKRYSIPSSNFVVPYLLNVFNINGVNIPLEFKPSPSIQNNTYGETYEESQTTDAQIDSVPNTFPFTISGGIVYSSIQEGNSYRYTFTSGSGTITFDSDTYLTYMVVGGGGNGGVGTVRFVTATSGAGGNGGQVVSATNVLFPKGTYTIGVGKENESSYISDSIVARGNYSGGGGSNTTDANSTYPTYGTYPSDGTIVRIGDITYEYGAGGAAGAAWATYYDSSHGSYGEDQLKASPLPPGYYGGGYGQTYNYLYDYSGYATEGIENTGGGGGGGAAAYENSSNTYVGPGAKGGSGIIVLYYTPT